MKRKIVIDTDPGHDDAIAIMTLLAELHHVDILGITTVAGNQTLEKVTTNMLKIVELTKCRIPVAMGESKPLSRELKTGAAAHGETGMDGPILPEPAMQPISRDGVSFLKDNIFESDDLVTILALGPLTNIARLFLEYPEVKSRIAEISLMGGGLAGGNITQAAEFNMYVDPEAADIVFKSGVPITMSGLDVTDKAQIYPQEWELLQSRGPASRVTAELLNFYNVSSREFGYIGSPLHDACAAVWLIAPEMFTQRQFHITVETQGEITRGMTVADRRRVPGQPPNVNVLLDVNREAFVTLIVKNLALLDTIITEK